MSLARYSKGFQSSMLCRLEVDAVHDGALLTDGSLVRQRARADPRQRARVRIMAHCQAPRNVVKGLETLNRGLSRYAAAGPGSLHGPGPRSALVTGSGATAAPPVPPQLNLVCVSWWTAGGSNPRPPDCESVE